MSGVVRRCVKVMDDTGAPLEGAFVAVEKSSVPFPEIALVTDAEGSVQLFLPEGHFRIVANARDDRRGAVEVNGGIEGGTDDIVIKVHS